MTSSIGIWIDKSKALIISPGRIIETINSDIDIRPRIEGQGKEYGRFGGQFLSLEKSRQNRLQQQEARFLKKVVDKIKSNERFLIFGPAQMKNKLHQQLREEYEMADKFIEVKNSERMTDNQYVAFVREFFERMDN